MTGQVQGALIRAFGRGIKIFSGTFAITGTGAVTVTGASAVTSAVACVTNASTVLSTQTASISSYTGTTINVVVTSHSSAANAVDTVAHNVDVIALVT